ncbi:threonine/serine exporter family protein [Paenibacillus thermoaerophilus]|uniref:Threonine/serine exporter family protein n=1 Tax=Paenibacillus thermoaerophilus TaxID=1215385 RepID=A0ABW2V456_9BACL|nr:threonine/serine exporter family protein [Paenibacillus thermoaerophilus]TMV14305.1 threonine/serine exporter family protein [Paenibacillus thermoaerophilus]
MGQSADTSYEITELCLLAGKIMLQSGGETYRVEDTMMRIAAACGYPESQSFVTPTGIIFTVNGLNPSTRLVRILERSTDLHKVTRVNDISRRIARGELDVPGALRLLKEIESGKPAYPEWLQAIAAAVASGCFLILFQGGWSNFLPAALAGGLGFALLIYLHRLVQIRFFAEFLASLVIGAISEGFVRIGFGSNLDQIIIGSVMPLVPGLLITNAVRDLMAGHLVSGLSKGAEAFLTATAIGSGIAIVLAVFN